MYDDIKMLNTALWFASGRHWAGPVRKGEAKRFGSGCEGCNMFPGTSTGKILASLVVKFVKSPS